VPQEQMHHSFVRIKKVVRLELGDVPEIAIKETPIKGRKLLDMIGAMPINGLHDMVQIIIDHGFNWGRFRNVTANVLRITLPRDINQRSSSIEKAIEKITEGSDSAMATDAAMAGEEALKEYLRLRQASPFHHSFFGSRIYSIDP